MKNQLTELQEAFIARLMEDLSCDDRANPNLYKVIRDVLKDHADEVDSIPQDALEDLGRPPRFKLHSETG